MFQRHLWIQMMAHYPFERIKSASVSIRCCHYDVAQGRRAELEAIGRVSADALKSEIVVAVAEAGQVIALALADLWHGYCVKIMVCLERAGVAFGTTRRAIKQEHSMPGIRA